MIAIVRPKAAYQSGTGERLPPFSPSIRLVNHAPVAYYCWPFRLPGAAPFHQH